jgi:hypothetical protein
MLCHRAVEWHAIKPCLLTNTTACAHAANEPIGGAGCTCIVCHIDTAYALSLSRQRCSGCVGCQRAYSGGHSATDHRLPLSTETVPFGFPSQLCRLEPRPKCRRAYVAPGSWWALARPWRTTDVTVVRVKPTAPATRRTVLVLKTLQHTVSSALGVVQLCQYL